MPCFEGQHDIPLSVGPQTDTECECELKERDCCSPSVAEAFVHDADVVCLRAHFGVDDDESYLFGQGQLCQGTVEMSSLSSL